MRLLLSGNAHPSDEWKNVRELVFIIIERNLIVIDAVISAVSCYRNANNSRVAPLSCPGPKSLDVRHTTYVTSCHQSSSPTVASISLGMSDSLLGFRSNRIALKCTAVVLQAWNRQTDRQTDKQMDGSHHCLMHPVVS